MEVTLIRIESGDNGTFGVLKIAGEVFCVTLEPENFKKAKDIDDYYCIPEGIYSCRLTYY